MSSDTITTEVIELVAVHSDAKPDRILMASRLLEDLGIDGDDAVDLFDSVHDRFGTDFTHLYECWSEHFGPEGMPLSAGLLWAPGFVAGWLTYFRLDEITWSVLAFIGGVLTAAPIVALSIWIAKAVGFIPKVKPITVGEVVDAVRAGTWPLGA